METMLTAIPEDDGPGVKKLLKADPRLATQRQIIREFLSLGLNPALKDSLV
jgi:hypothetical protein